jgi:LuxR family transcriptional regulator, quorum-sensing system regulator SdiA
MPLHYIEQAIAANSVEEVWTLLTAKMETYGFDRMLYGFTRNVTAYGLGGPDDFMVLSNHPPEYTRRFIEDRLYDHAPMFNWALRNVGSCSWRWVEENAHRLTEREREVIAFNRSMDVNAGYTISFRDHRIRNRAGIGLAARNGMSQSEVDALWADSGREIEVMCHVTHLVFTTLPYTPPGRTLTPRQREVLEWVGDGKTTLDISTIMGVSPATIEKHLRLAREALDVETTAQAVLKASFQNQLYAVYV